MKILVVGLSYKYGVADLRNSLNLEIFKKIKSKYKNTTFFDPFVKKSNKLNKKNINNIDIALFLTKGRLFIDFYEKMKKKKKILIDPFKYYS